MDKNTNVKGNRTPHVRAKDRNRQQRLTERRNNEGLRMVKLYLHDETMNELKAIAEKSMHSDVSTTYQGKIEDISKLVSYCIRLANIQGEEEYNYYKGAHEMLNIQQVVKARKAGFKTKTFELEPQSVGAITRFMNKNKYLTIDALRSYSKKFRRWTTDDVKLCLNDNAFYEILKQYNQELAKKNNPVKT